MMNSHRTSRRQRYIELMAGRGGGLGPMLLRATASAGSALYALVIAARNRAYQVGLLKARRLGRPVISVGNLSAGGTGKTVLVAEIARWVLVAGSRPAVLLRGYKPGGGRPGWANQQGPGLPASDEAAMLGELLGPDVSVEPDPDRYAAGQRLLAGRNPPDLFILDDGFQHRRLTRDLDIVTIDMTMDLAGPLGRMLPRGLLREPTSSLARADFIVLTRVDQAEPDVVEHIWRTIARAAPDVPLLRTRHAAASLCAAQTQPDCAVEPHPTRPLETLAERRFLAFAGIGNPMAFNRTICQLPGRCVQFVAFDDHHDYTADDLAGLVARARAADADCLLTTRKDLVKIDPTWADLPIYAVNVELAWLDDCGPLKEKVLALCRGTNS